MTREGDENLQAGLLGLAEGVCLEDIREETYILIPQDHKIQNFFRKLKFKIPKYKKLKVDKYGYLVLVSIQENKTFLEICQSLEKNFGEEIKPTEEKLRLFIKQMAYLKIIK